jgi:hypothetical protein
MIINLSLDTAVREAPKCYLRYYRPRSPKKEFYTLYAEEFQMEPYLEYNRPTF